MSIRNSKHLTLKESTNKRIEQLNKKTPSTKNSPVVKSIGINRKGLLKRMDDYWGGFGQIQA